MTDAFRSLEDKVTGAFMNKPRPQRRGETAKETLKRVLREDGKSPDELEEQKELIRRTKATWKEAKAKLDNFEAEKDESFGELTRMDCVRKRRDSFDWGDLIAWERRWRREYDDALEGKNSTDYLAYVREKE